MSGAKAEDRARVKALVVDRLEQAGMARKRGVSAAVHEATMGRICERLAYMSDDNLMTLAETLIDNAPDARTAAISSSRASTGCITMRISIRV
ncbi:hypothetical protein U5903_22655, partial [Cereibacter johrii]|nr:hypothetical protein [Cereibacter johrii]